MVPSSPAEFVLEYLKERERLAQASVRLSAAYRKRYLSPAYVAGFDQGMEREAMYRALLPPVVLAVESRDGRVMVKTKEPLGTEYAFRCYWLISTQDGWRIDQRGWRCTVCDGVGIEDGAACRLCEGEGWKVTRRD